MANGVKRIFFDLINPQIIYPILIYTDNAYGYDGINQQYMDEFRKKVKDLFAQQRVQDVTFINISFFENCLSFNNGEDLDIFEIITEFHLHIKQVDFASTPFEVFAMAFLRRKKCNNPEGNPMFTEILSEMKLKGLE